MFYQPKKYLAPGKKIGDTGFTFSHGMMIKFYYPNEASFITTKKRKKIFIFHSCLSLLNHHSIYATHCHPDMSLEYFSYFSNQILWKMIAENKVTGIRNNKFRKYIDCENCNLVKSMRASHSPMDAKLIWIKRSHLYGSAKIPLIGKDLYFLTFFNDLSQRAFIYPLKDKKNVWDIFLILSNGRTPNRKEIKSA